ncbi:MAG: bifunctional oligoribonuclease/PAP phosphatase NrnA [Clostridiales bacterium]|nr:bifunctional oligoribonuclease/PAP phosphatase NrnA [Clostridiales bacterium]
MRINAAYAAELLKSKDNILILTHDHPDGDTLGTAYALCRALRSLGKKAVVKCPDKIPASYAFMWQNLPEQDFEPAFIVAVDIADSVLLGAEYEAIYKDIINLSIDHHGSNNLKADYILLESDAAAAAEIIYDVLMELGASLDPAIADCIYTGLSTDTGCFRYSNTSARSHRLAAILIDAGANKDEINQVFFETKSRVYAALERLALDSMTMYFDDRLAVITIVQEMFRITGANESECDRLSALPRQIEGVLVGVTLRETKDGNFKASIRTNGPLNAAVLAAKMGGGGHAKAAGCRLDGPLEKAMEVLLKNVSEEIAP